MLPKKQWESLIRCFCFVSLNYSHHSLGLGGCFKAEDGETQGGEVAFLGSYNINHHRPNLKSGSCHYGILLLSEPSGEGREEMVLVTNLRRH